MKSINVLGTDYTIQIRSSLEDEFLKTCDGYCDKTSKKIVVLDKEDDNELECFSAYQKKVMRHEIIHAFLYESGLAENWEHLKEFGHEETTIDWFAIQFSKILKAFQQAECI